MSSIRVSGNTSGYYDLTVPDIAGNNTLPINQIVAADSSGNVGIGTDSPTAKLNVKSSSYPYVRITNDGYTGLDIGQADSGEGGAALIKLRDAADMDFYTADINRMRISSTGNVGIGTVTSDPLRKLHLKDSGDVHLLLQSSGAVNDSEIFEIGVGANSSNKVDLTFRTRANDATGGAEHMRITNDGLIGIGDSGPDAKLHVAGNVKIGSASSSAWASSIHDAGGLDVIVGSGSTGLSVWDDNAQAVPRFLVQRGGNVGINTSTPASHLDVKGNLRITRNVAAGDASEGNWVFNISMESAAYYGSLYISPSVSTGELSIMGDKFRVTQNSGVQINSDTNNSTSTDNIAIRYNGTSGGHKTGYLFKDKRGSVNAAVKNNLQDDSPTNYGAHLELHSSQFGSLNRGITLRNSGKVEFDKMPNFATRPYYTNTELGSGAVVDFYNAHVNTGNHFNGTTNRFNAPYAGDYYFAFHSNIWRNAAGILYFDWYVNGSSIVNTYGGRIYGYYAGGWENIMGFVTIPLAANDYVELRAGGGGPKVDGGAYGQFMGYALTSP